MSAKPVTIPFDDGKALSGLWLKPPGATALLVLAHGAGAGMTHKAMAATADGLAARAIATLRFNFPYMEQGSKRPDRPAVAHQAVLAAIDRARTLAPGLSLFAGGRSFGGRMTSQTLAATPIAALKGLVFFAFPLHLAGKPGIERADHFAAIKTPMLFLQGTRDTLADIDLLKGVVKSLGRRATLHLAPDADHSFHVPAKTGRKDADVMDDLLDTAAAWMTKHN